MENPGARRKSVIKGKNLPSALLRRILEKDLNPESSQIKRVKIKKLHSPQFSLGADVPTPLNILKSFENSPLITEPNMSVNNKHQPTDIAMSISSLNQSYSRTQKSPVSTIASRVVVVKERGRNSPESRVYLALKEKKQQYFTCQDDSTYEFKYRSQNQSKPSLKNSKLMLSDTVGEVTNTTPESFSMKNEPEIVKKETQKDGAWQKSDHFYKNQFQVKLKKDILKKVLSVATSTPNKPRALQNASPISTMTTSSSTVNVTFKHFEGLKVKKREITQVKKMTRSSSTSQANPINTPKSQTEEPKDRKTVEIGTPSSEELYKSIRLRYLMEPEEELKLRKDLKVNFKAFMTENLDPKKVKYSTVFVNNTYKTKKGVEKIDGFDQLHERLGEDIPSSQMTFGRKSVRRPILPEIVNVEKTSEPYVEKMSSSNVEKEKRAWGLVTEMRQMNNLMENMSNLY